jgi:hypothetical protein
MWREIGKAFLSNAARVILELVGVKGKGATDQKTCRVVAYITRWRPTCVVVTATLNVGPLD